MLASLPAVAVGSSPVVDQLIQGRLPAGSRLTEEALAEEFGVSRTPLRECLVAISEGGFLEFSPNRGFKVLPLQAQEVAGLYPVLWMLESLALAKSPPAEALARLRGVNRRLLRHRRAPLEALRLDTEWHQVLTAHHGNAYLGQIGLELGGHHGEGDDVGALLQIEHDPVTHDREVLVVDGEQAARGWWNLLHCAWTV